MIGHVGRELSSCESTSPIARTTRRYNLSTGRLAAIAARSPQGSEPRQTPRPLPSTRACCWFRPARCRSPIRPCQPRPCVSATWPRPREERMFMVFGLEPGLRERLERDGSDDGRVCCHALALQWPRCLERESAHQTPGRRLRSGWRQSLALVQRPAHQTTAIASLAGSTAPRQRPRPAARPHARPLDANPRPLSAPRGSGCSPSALLVAGLSPGRVCAAVERGGLRSHPAAERGLENGVGGAVIEQFRCCFDRPSSSPTHAARRRSRRSACSWARGRVVDGPGGTVRLASTGLARARDVPPAAAIDLRPA